MTERKVALVAGGGRNLGEHLAHRLAKEGYDVVVADLLVDNAEKVAKEIASEEGAKTLAIQADFTQENDVISMVQKTEKEFGRIDLLLYVAGLTISREIRDYTLKDWHASIDVNLTGYFLCAREVAKVMVQQGFGNMIHINSKTGKVGSKHNPAYSAAKFGGVGLTQSLALDLAEHGIRVNTIMVGNLLESPMFQSLIPQYAKKLGIREDEVVQVYKDKVPLKRGCHYEDVANAVVFYSSDQASYMTGQSVNVTGGQVMH